MDLLSLMSTGPALVAFLVAVGVYVLTFNFSRACAEPLRVEPLAGEAQLDRIEIRDALRSERAVVSDRRITTLSVRWPLSVRRHLSVAWTDVNSIRWSHGMSTTLLALGLGCALGGSNPAALVLVMLGLEWRVGTLVFETPFALMPLSRPSLVAWRRSDVLALDAFHRRVRAIWARARTAAGLKVTELPPVSAGATLPDLVWGRTVWFATIAFLGVATLQRAVADHLSLDNIVFLPVFLGLVAAVGAVSRRDGVWVAVLGTAALFSIKFPVPGLGDGVPWYPQFLWLGLVFVAVALASDAARRYVSPLLSALAPLLWVVYIWLLAPSELVDLSLYGRVLMAMAATIAWNQLLVPGSGLPRAMGRAR